MAAGFPGMGDIYLQQMRELASVSMPPNILCNQMINCFSNILNINEICAGTC